MSAAGEYSVRPNYQVSAALRLAQQANQEGRRKRRRKRRPDPDEEAPAPPAPSDGTDEDDAHFVDLLA